MHKKPFTTPGLVFAIVAAATVSTSAADSVSTNRGDLGEPGKYRALLTSSEGGNPGVTAPLVTPPAAPESKAPTGKSRADILDELFQRLASANDAEEAGGVALVIQHVWMQSGSDTADLLVGRAGLASDKGDRDLAINLLDKVVELDPSWAEGWNKRATLRFLNEDDVGSMDDIAHVLTLEPRHFGALTGMVAILLRAGMKKDALAMLRKAAVIYPHNADVEKQIESLTPDVEGRGI